MEMIFHDTEDYSRGDNSQGDNEDESENEEDESKTGDDESGSEEEDYEWTPLRTEGDLEIELFKMWEAESAVYQRMKEYQGSHIRNLLASVELTSPNANLNPEAKAAVDLGTFEPFVVKGVLLE